MDMGAENDGNVANDNYEDDDDDYEIPVPTQSTTQAAAILIKNKNKCPSLQDLKAEFAALNITETFELKTKTHYLKTRPDMKPYNDLKWANYLHDGRLEKVEYHGRNKVYIPIENSKAHLRMTHKTAAAYAHKIAGTVNFGWLCGYDENKKKIIRMYEEESEMTAAAHALWNYYYDLEVKDSIFSTSMKKGLILTLEDCEFGNNGKIFKCLFHENCTRYIYLAHFDSKTKIFLTGQHSSDN